MLLPAICQGKEKCKGTYVKDTPLSLVLGVVIETNINAGLAETLREANENMYGHKMAQRQRERMSGKNSDQRS